MKKYYIAPDIECIDMEPLQVIAASISNTPDKDDIEIGGGEEASGGAESKEHRGDIWEF